MSRRSSVNGQTAGEEIFNSISHGIGIGLSVAGLIILVVPSALKGDSLKVFSFSIFGASLILLYISSTLYHALTNVRAKKIFRIFDHSAIYLLIAGTDTPYMLVSLGGFWGWSLFAVIWFTAALGIFIKSRYTGKFDTLSTILYLLMGWILVLTYKQLAASIPFMGIVWIFIGGAFYTFGIIFYFIDTRMPFSHSIWHLFVMGGSISFFFSMRLYIV